MEINCVVEHLNNLMREPTERDMNYLKIKSKELKYKAKYPSSIKETLGLRSI